MDFLYGKRSNRILELAHPELKYVAKLALALGIMDFTIVESYRDESTQNRYHQTGKSKVQWPFSKHNLNPSLALDIAPCINGKVSWDERHCLVMAGIILSASECLGVQIRWGGNWDRDGEPITDQEFQDLVHFELVR